MSRYTVNDITVRPETPYNTVHDPITPKEILRPKAWEKVKNRQQLVGLELEIVIEDLEPYKGKFNDHQQKIIDYYKINL